MDHRRGTDDKLDGTGAPRDAKHRDLVIGDLDGLRSSDIEPYTGLRYLSKLFRFMAVVLVLLLIAEVATGLYTQGTTAIPTLLGEASRLVVLAGVLWGTGDLAHLLIDVGHDVRAGRILMARGSAGGAAFMPRDRSSSRGRTDAVGDGVAVPIVDRSATGARQFADLPPNRNDPRTP